MSLCGIFIFWTLSGLFYVIYLLLHAKTFIYLPKSKSENTTHKISIIIPARNEAKNIQKCLESIFIQDYPIENLEIILVDDSSTDQTVKIAEQCLQKSPFSWKIHSISEQSKTGKKEAIRIGISLATHEVLLLTDADTFRSKNWVKSMSSSFTKDQIWVSGPVKMTGNSVLQQMQALESAGLIALGAAMIGRKKAGLANGANLMYRKKHFDQVDGFQGINDIASGDDELLVHKLSKLGNGTFCKNPEAIIETNACESFTELIQQRIRWVSKSRKYENENMTRTLTLAWIFHVGLLILPILIFVYKSKIGLAVYGMMLILKMLAELSILIPASRFLKNQNHLKWFFFEQIFYIFYVVFIGIWGNLGLKYRWKDRKVN